MRIITILHTMPVGLKLTASFASIYGHKPYTFFPTFTSTTTSTSTAVNTNHQAVPPTLIYRCRRIATPAPAYPFPAKVLGVSCLSMGSAFRPSSSPSKSAKLLTLPTILTIGRVAAIPILVTTFYVDSWWGPTATTGIFIAAAITDWLDGYLARKMNLGTAFGAFLDPVADKLMVAATLILLCTRPLEASVFGQLPWLLTVPSIAIIGREITMSAVREWAASQGGKLSEAVAVNNLGKWKTATQMIALTILLVTRDSSLSGAGIFVASGVILLYVSAWLAVWSLVVYMRKIWKVLLM
ncbi:CDP-diacylglycerol--glycerol-3-phosphate 3-phosphatidyltransferase 2-like [Nicotiana sylvestris]